MDELKIKSPGMRGLIGRAITRYLNKNGIEMKVLINDLDGVSTTEGNDVKLRADIVIEMSKAQVVKMLS